MKDILTVLISILLLALLFYIFTFKIVQTVIVIAGLTFMFLFILGALFEVIYPIVDHLFKKKKK